MKTFPRVFVVLLFAQIVCFGVLIIIEYQQETKRIVQEQVAHEAQQRLLEQQRMEAERIAEQARQKEQAHQVALEQSLQRTYDDNTQFVMISFDGSRSLATWETTVGFAEQLRSEGTPIKFTYFISGVYFIPDSQKYLYNLSWQSPGSSNILFGDPVEQTDERIRWVNRAYAAGHEIGSHLNGHFDGSNWSASQWSEEFNFFENILFDNLSEKITRNVQPNFSIDDIKGLRSPLLSKNSALYQTLAEKGFTYDASKVAPIGTQPWKDNFGIWQFPLVPLKVGGKNSLSMDYNHYEAQTRVKDVLKRGTPEWAQAKQDVLDAYRFYFESEYNGVRAPINIGHHFSMWNDGVYWEALKEFAREVCVKKDVVCTNYSDLVEFLEQ